MTKVQCCDHHSNTFKEATLLYRTPFRHPNPPKPLHDKPLIAHLRTSWWTLVVPRSYCWPPKDKCCNSRPLAPLQSNDDTTSVEHCCCHRHYVVCWPRLAGLSMIGMLWTMITPLAARRWQWKNKLNSIPPKELWKCLAHCQTKLKLLQSKDKIESA